MRTVKRTTMTKDNPNRTTGKTRMKLKRRRRFLLCLTQPEKWLFIA